MDSDSQSSDHDVHDSTVRPPESLSMAIRQLRPFAAQLPRSHADEIPESEEEDAHEAGGEEVNGDDAGHGYGDDDISDHEDELPRRRHSISSQGSVYSPSIASIADDYRPPRPEPHHPTTPRRQHLPSTSNRHRPRFSPSSTVPPTPTTQWPSSPLKRSYSLSLSPVPGSGPDPDLDPDHRLPTAKRARTTAITTTSGGAQRRPAGADPPFNPAYLALLNEDIRDAAARFAPPHSPNATDDGDDDDDDDHDGDEERRAPPPSQLGLTVWTAAEKTLFFEALARLGRDDARGIAERVGTKGEVEVRAYLALLERECRGQGGEGEGEGKGKGECEDDRGGGARARARARGRGRGTAAVAMHEVPAAVEIGQACCAALEEAADRVAARQAAYEEGEERKRWGEGRWLVGVGNVRELEREEKRRMARRGGDGREIAGGMDLGEKGMPSLRFFRVTNWLRLADRVFMNAAVDEYNWASVAAPGEKPAMRATALEDFYALAVSLTRRLVAATIYVGESRVRAKRAVYPETRSRVWRKDVEAAALSLGLQTNSRRFWAKCARRLRLDVYDDDSDTGVEDWGGEDGPPGWEGEEGQEKEPMSYDEVERALGLDVEVVVKEGDSSEEEEEEEEEEEDDDEDHDKSSPAPQSDGGSVDLGGGAPEPSEHDEAPEKEDDKAEKAAVKREMNEVLVHSALEYPNTVRARDALRARIRAERAHEAYAAALDARASYLEEKRLWAVLGRQPPMELPKVEVPGKPPRCTKRTVDDLVMGFSRMPVEGDWRSKLEVVPSRWEMEYVVMEREDGGRAKGKG